MLETELQRVGQLASLVVVLLGLWVVVTPWFWGGSNCAGFFGGSSVLINWLFWSNTVTGIMITGLSVYTTLQIQRDIQAE
jgi:hypothetical protein